MLNKYKISAIAITILLFIIPLILTIIQAQESPELPGDIKKIQDVGEKLTDKEIRTAYLKQEWGKILRKSPYFSPLFIVWDKISPVVNPISKFVFGVEPSLSWLFFLTVAIWIFTVVYILRIFQLTSPFSDWVSRILSLGFGLVLGITGGVKKMAEGIISLVSLVNIWWVQLIIIAGIIIGFFIASFLSKSFKEWINEVREMKNKTEEEINRERLKRAAELGEQIFGR